MSLGWIQVSSSEMSFILWGNHLGPRDGAAVRRCQLDRADPGQAQEARGNTHPAHILPGKKSVWSHCFERCLVWSVFICHVMRRVLSKRVFYWKLDGKIKKILFYCLSCMQEKTLQKKTRDFIGSPLHSMQFHLHSAWRIFLLIRIRQSIVRVLISPSIGLLVEPGHQVGLLLLFPWPVDPLSHHDIRGNHRGWVTQVKNIGVFFSSKREFKY